MGHIWQRRFYDFVVRSEGKKIEKLKYIHRKSSETPKLVLEPDQGSGAVFGGMLTANVGQR